MSGLLPESSKVMMIGLVISMWSWAPSQGCETDVSHCIISRTIKAPEGCVYKDNSVGSNLEPECAEVYVSAVHTSFSRLHMVMWGDRAVAEWRGNNLTTILSHLWPEDILLDGCSRDFPEDAVATEGHVPVIERTLGSQERLLFSPSYRPLNKASVESFSNPPLFCHRA